MKKKNILVAAGGTGGHLFPSIAVIEELEKKGFDKNQMTFAGNPEKIEGRVVPSLGYPFLPLNISGFSKILSIESVILPFKILGSILKVKRFIKNNNIGLVICAGAYLSYPTGLAAYYSGIPLVLMESNVFPGKTIKLLSKKANFIACAYEDSFKYFDKSIHHKIKILGNPVRNNFSSLMDKQTARKSLNLEENKFTILIFGGSLGAKNINLAIEKIIENQDLNSQYIWQTGKNYKAKKNQNNLLIYEFIDDMATAYSASDLVICRAGATTISELCVTGKPSILVPYPYSANNHQEFNAKMMARAGASIIINDNELEHKLLSSIFEIIHNQSKLAEMGENARKLANFNSARLIAEEIANLFNSIYFH